MNLDRAVLALAGTFTLVSALLAALVSPWWLLLTAFGTSFALLTAYGLWHLGFPAPSELGDR